MLLFDLFQELCLSLIFIMYLFIIHLNLLQIYYNIAEFITINILSLLQCCFCFMVWFFSSEACENLAPQQGIEPTPPPALKGEVLTTGLPGKSP